VGIGGAAATAVARASARKRTRGGESRPRLRQEVRPHGSDPNCHGATIRRVAKHQLTELATGERVISERLQGVRSVAIGFWVGAGSRDEPGARAGISHFIEHLLFKGSSRYSAQEIAEVFDELGGELNAATSRETTVIFARIPDDRLEKAIDVMVDMVFLPSFTDVDSEREVVLEEIAMVEDTPHDLVHDFAAEAVFGTHPLGRPVIGRADVISSVSRRALAAYHRRAYSAEQIVLAAAGNLRHERLVELLEERRNGASAGGGLPTRKSIRRTPRPGLRFQSKETEQYHVCLSAPGIARMDERRFAASILDAIVGGSASSRLFQEIREKRGMAYSVYTYSSQYADAGQIGLYVGTREENLSTCLEIAVAELADVAAGNVRRDELERAKENLKGRLLLSLESTSNRMTRLGKATITGTPLLSPEEIVRRLEAVSGDEVAELADELLAPARLSAAGIGPDESRFRDAVARVNPALLSRAA
jgi:predicted Zn-dependent peptidase